MLGHKLTPNKFKRTEIILNMSSHHTGIKLEIDNRRKIHEQMEIKYTLVHNQWVSKEIARETKSTMRQMETKTQHTKMTRFG